MPKRERFGMKRKSAEELLTKLLQQKGEIQKEMEAFGKVSLANGIPMKYIELQQRLQAVQESIIQTRDWYSVNVLEALEIETRTLKWLTVVLIGLTIVLALFTGLLVSGIRIP